MRMMKNLLLIVTIVSFSLIGCSNDDDANPNQDPLEGNWSLVRITGGFAGVNDTIPPNLRKYTFTNGTLTVVNTSTDQYPTFLQNGEYPYKLSTENNEQILLINTRDYQVISLEANTFGIGDDIPVDGLGYSFER